MHQRSTAKNARVQYYLTLDSAKHIAMLSGSKKGYEVREYFIAKEKELLALTTNPAAALDAYPELQAILQQMRAVEQLVLSTAEARAVADAAKAEAEQARLDASRAAQQAIHAEQKADAALDTQQRFTVAEYVRFEHLGAKIPERAYKSLSDHLRCYCMDHNIPFRRAPIGGKAWSEEYEYHISVYDAALPGWLMRQFAQREL